MELIFKIVSYHRLSPEQVSKKSIKDSITLGRSESNDWHLPDPEKVVSGVHAKVVRQSDSFFIYDLSTNGLFINRAVEALGKDKSHKLMPDDLLSFGDYEVSVSFAEQESLDTPSEVKGLNSSNLADNLFSHDTSAEKFKPQVNNELDDYFIAPQPIPEEWDDDLLKMSSKPSKDVPVVPLNIEPELTQAKKVHQQKVEQPIPKSPPKKVNSIPQSSFQEPVVQKRTVSSSVTTGQLAFFEGLGISSEVASGVMSDKLMHDMGECMQLMLLGLMESLRNRTNLKNEFKVNQTTFQQKENNPLKFSASIDDVFQNLFLTKSTSFLPANKAITEAFNDTKKHDIALSAGTLGEIEGILNQLDPNRIESRDIKGSMLDNVLPGNKQLRYWKLYKTLHMDMTNDISNQGSSALSDDFVRAYDKTIKSL